MTNLENYKNFYLVSKYGSISKAASKLFISQPALTKAIKKFEGELGFKLFTRNTKGITLTTEGEFLYNHIKNSVELLINTDNMKSSILNSSTNNINIGLSSALCKFFLIPRLVDFKKEYDEVKIELFIDSFNNTVELLKNNELDFVIAYVAEFNDNFYYEKLFDVTDVFVCGNNYNNEHKINLCEIDSVLLPSNKNMSRLMLENYFRQYNIKVNTVVEINSTDLLLDLCKIDYGVTLAVKEFITHELEEKSLVILDLPPLPLRSIYLIYKKDKNINFVLNKFRTYINKSI